MVMKFNRKYYLKFPKDLFEGFEKKVFIGKRKIDVSDELLLSICDNIDFTENKEVSFLPKKVGRFSKFNADGKEIVRRDLPKEYVSVMRYYTRWEFHGRDNRVEVEDYYYHTYKRYPRECKDAPNVLVNYIEGCFVVELDPQDDESLNLHKLNLMIELFGFEMSIFDFVNDAMIERIKPLRWEILPAGKYTSEELLNRIKNSMPTKMKKTVKLIIEKRLEKISSFSTYKEVYCGLAGYMGYIVFIFENKNIAVLECDKQNNATYIFDIDNWKELSQKSKTEILRENLAKKRIIHNKSWFKEIENLLG